MEAVHSSERQVDFCCSTRHYNPNHTFHSFILLLFTLMLFSTLSMLEAMWQGRCSPLVRMLKICKDSKNSIITEAQHWCTRPLWGVPSMVRIHVEYRSFRINTLYLYACLWLLPIFYQSSHSRVPCLQREGNNSPQLHATLCPSRWVFKQIPKRKYSKDLDLGLGNGRLFSTRYFFGPSCVVDLVSEFNPEHITFPN
jgi:hypothetical protein